MEESLTGREREPAGNPAEMNALTLAYIGDAVFELEVRSYMLLHGSQKVEKLHRKVTSFVNAAFQSRLVGILEPVFTEEENSVYHRGRNSKTLTPAKHQTITDYRRATGLEAVFGYLYLKGDRSRIRELLALCFTEAEQERND